MSTVLTTADMIAASRVNALRDAVVATFEPVFPQFEVKAHPGKLDIADIVAQDMFRPPALAIAALRVKPEERASGSEDLVVDLAAYVIVEDGPWGPSNGLIYRDELGYAVGAALIRLLSATGPDAVNRWGLIDVGMPADVEMKPLFTVKSYERGSAFYAVTWRQVLYHTGPTIWDMDSPAPPDLDTTTYVNEEPPPPPLPGGGA